MTQSDTPKVLDARQLKSRIAPLQKAGRKIVFTNGCFDILHAGHVRYLKAARSQGDLLVVGLNSDASVRAIEGSGQLAINRTGCVRIIAQVHRKQATFPKARRSGEGPQGSLQRFHHIATPNDLRRLFPLE